jgi:hypothetical protein
MKNPFMFLGVIFVLCCLKSGAFTDYYSRASADDGNLKPWVLSNEQRRELLYFYSPIIFKQAFENRKQLLGRDWITNFDFDGDGNFSNNMQLWESELEQRITNREGFSNVWRIRPTLYTALIEFMEGKRKSVVMLYHIYHAMQEWTIHDWERVEIRLDGLTPEGAGNGEQIRYVVITEHSKHSARGIASKGILHPDLNFYETANGKHLLVYQAKWRNQPPLRKGELHFVTQRWTAKMIQQSAPTQLVQINGFGKTPFHYVFVPRADSEAISQWQARKITPDNRAELASGVGQANNLEPGRTRRIHYELQDIADILPTHLASVSWRKVKRIKMESPILNEDGSIAVEVPESGYLDFYYRAKNVLNPKEKKRGYPYKHWFWGVYFWGNEGCSYKPLNWMQHEYFVHHGLPGDGISFEAEHGLWLGRGEYRHWYTSDKGGFDGRWVQLFAD